jgi:hypothetical protein
MAWHFARDNMQIQMDDAHKDLYDHMIYRVFDTNVDFVVNRITDEIYAKDEK